MNMNAATSDDPAVLSFLDEVEKEITTEAPTDSLYHPQLGDLVTVEVGNEGRTTVDSGVTRTWEFGAGVPFTVAGVDINRCVRTMRRGECATVRAKVSSLPATPLRLVDIERQEDLLGDGRLIRVTLKDGDGWQTPQAGNELRVRFSWHVVHSAPGKGANMPPLPPTTTTVFLAGPSEQQADLAASSALFDLRRALLHRFGGTVLVQAAQESTSIEAGSVLCVEREDGTVVAGGRGSGRGMTVAEVQAALKAIENGATESVPAYREPREVVMSIDETQCVCNAEDWIPGLLGVRALLDIRAGQRCLVRLAPECIKPQVGLPAGATVEYDVEMLQILTLEDVSLDHSRGVIKKTMRQGEGYEKPAEGAEATVRVEVRDDTSGVVLVDEREITFQMASGKFCSALEETLLTMKQGETCEVRCTDFSTCTDAELKLFPGKDAKVVFSLELLSFEKAETDSSGAKALEKCHRRKEVATSFFQAQNWRRALKRYQHIVSILMYVDHWDDADAKSQAVALRRVCNLNAAACWLKVEAWQEAEKACGAVLKEEPENVKALFRRGQAFKELGEYREAERDIKRVLEIDKDNKEAARMLLKVRQFVKKEVEGQKEMFSRMAKGLGTQVADQAKPARDDCVNLDADDAKDVKASEEDATVDNAKNMKASEEDATVESTLASDDLDSTDRWLLGISALLVCAAIGFAYLRSRPK